MTATTFTRRGFNQDTSGAKKAAAQGPAFITDRGRPAHVLLTIEGLSSPDRWAYEPCGSPCTTGRGL